VLRDVEPLFALSEKNHEALKYKIEQVQRSVRYSGIMSRLRQRHLLVWIGAVVSNPWFILMFFKKALEDLQAMIHRRLHGVRKRDSQ
jgi:hypothetical protein